MGLERLGPSRGQHTMHRKDGVIHPIRDPESLTPEQRVDAIANYEMQFESHRLRVYTAADVEAQIRETKGCVQRLVSPFGKTGG
jgi:hypothetical protein